MESIKSILRTLGGLAIVIVFCLAVLLSGCAEVEKPMADIDGGYIQDLSDDGISDTQKSDGEIIEQAAAGDYTVQLIGGGVCRDEDGNIYADSLKVSVSIGDGGDPLSSKPVSEAIRRDDDKAFFISAAIAKPNLIVYEMEYESKPCYVIRINNYYTEEKALSHIFALKDGRIFSLQGDFTITDKVISEVAAFDDFTVDRLGCTLNINSDSNIHINYCFDFSVMTDETEIYTYTAVYAPLKSGMPNPLAYYDGDDNVGFYETVSEKLSIDYSISDTVDAGAFQSWMDEAVKAEYTSVRLNPNIYSFMKHFGFTPDRMRESLEKYYLGEGEYSLTKEEIELLVSDDAVGIAEYFASEIPIRKGENLYSLYWIYSHPIEDYIAHGITPEEIKEKLPLFDDYPLTEEAKTALYEKISEYIGNKG